MSLQELFNQAQKLRNNGDTDEAIRLYQQIKNESDDKELVADATHMTGVALFQSKKYQAAKEELLKAKKLFDEENNDIKVGAVLRDIGLCEAGEKKFEEAENYLIESIKVLKTTENYGHLGISEVKLGKVVAEKGDFAAAKISIEEGIANLQKSEDKFFLSSGYLDFGKLLIKMGDKDGAKTALQKSLEILNEIGGEEEFKERREEINNLLGSLDKN